jgi:prepilin-type processing-associated H-X9-DG protein
MQLPPALASSAPSNHERQLASQSGGSSDGVRFNFSSSCSPWASSERKKDADGKIGSGIILKPAIETADYADGADEQEFPGARQGGGPAATVLPRSYLLNGALNGNDLNQHPAALAIIRTKSAQLTRPSPAHLIAFLDGSEGTTLGGAFWIWPLGQPGQNRDHWLCQPSDRHRRGANLSFVDGHVAFQRWRWPKEVIIPGNIPVANSEDLKDLGCRTACRNRSNSLCGLPLALTPRLCPA